jgi:hypothetical protein
VVNFVVSGYYNVIIAYSLVYFILGLSSAEVPWYGCGNAWNSDDCIGVRKKIEFLIFLYFFFTLESKPNNNGRIFEIEAKVHVQFLPASGPLHI